MGQCLQSKICGYVLRFMKRKMWMDILSTLFCRNKNVPIIAITFMICLLLVVAQKVEQPIYSGSLDGIKAKKYTLPMETTNQVTTVAETTRTATGTTAVMMSNATEGPTTKPIACPDSHVVEVTNVMQELVEMREQFLFTLTPWKVIQAANSSFNDTGVRWSMIVMVKSHSTHAWDRTIARLTWAQQKYHNGVRMETIFIVGKGENKNAEIELSKENKLYGDLLQLDRVEKYEDVVNKTLAGMQYAGTHFPCDWIYTSADDDIMPNLAKMAENIEKFIINEDNIKTEANGTCQGNSPLTIVCGFDCAYGSKPQRHLRDKWYVSRTLYPLDWYPPYCLGPWYSMRTKHALELYTISRKFPIFWIDDVWITGNLRLQHILKDPNYTCIPTDLSTGLTPKGYRLVEIGNINWRVASWNEYYEKHWMRKEREC